MILTIVKMFIVKATAGVSRLKLYLSLTLRKNKLECSLLGSIFTLESLPECLVTPPLLGLTPSLANKKGTIAIILAKYKRSSLFATTLLTKEKV